MSRRLATALLLGALLAGCGRYQMPTAEEASAKEGAMWDQVAAALAAEAKAGLAGGGRCLLVRSSPSAAVAADHDAIEAALRRDLPADRLVTVVIPDAPKPAGADESFPVLSRPLELAWLAKQLAAHQPAAVAISLAGAPAEPGPKPGVPLVCFAPEADQPLKQQIHDGLVRAAVVTAHHVSPAETDWFKIRFAVVNAANVDAW